MALTEECEKHEMIGCQICNPRPVLPPEPDSRPFLAQYDGQCPECNLPIIAGRHQIIFRVTGDGIAAWRLAIHERCA